MAETNGNAKTETPSRESETATENQPKEKILKPVVKASGRVGSFRHLAERIAEGAQTVPPRMLTGIDRHHHARATLREDHQTRIEAQSQGRQNKFKKLAKSRFKFFRSTQLVFYRDMVGEDAHTPTVLAPDRHASSHHPRPQAKPGC